MYGGIMSGFFMYGGIMSGFFMYGGIMSGFYGGIMSGFFMYGGIMSGFYGGIMSGFYGGIMSGFYMYWQQSYEYTRPPVVFTHTPAPVKWSWTVHEWFLNSSCAVHEHLFMNSSWIIHEHEMAKFMKLVRFMNLEFINLSSWTCEFMNYSWTIVHE